MTTIEITTILIAAMTLQVIYTATIVAIVVAITKKK